MVFAAPADANDKAAGGQGDQIRLGGCVGGDDCLAQRAVAVADAVIGVSQFGDGVRGGIGVVNATTRVKGCPKGNRERADRQDGEASLAHV